MLTYQMTRITKDRGSLAHDDRLDVLSMGVAYFIQQMAANADQEILDRREQLLDEELDKFINGINTSKYRPKSTTWMSI